MSVPADAARIACELVGGALARLRATRPVFHNERDLQFAFALAVQAQRPDALVIPETRLVRGQNRRMDLRVRTDEVTVGFELKVSDDGDARGRERRLVRAQDGRSRSGARRLRHGVIRLEGAVAAGEADAAAAVMIINWPLWTAKPPAGRGVAAETEFRLVEGRELTGRIAWAGTATWWQGTYPPHVDLHGRYPIAWQPYSAVPGTGACEFRSLTCFVASEPGG